MTAGWRMILCSCYGLSGFSAFQLIAKPQPILRWYLDVKSWEVLRVRRGHKDGVPIIR